MRRAAVARGRTVRQRFPAGGPSIEWPRGATPTSISPRGLPVHCRVADSLDDRYMRHFRPERCIGIGMASWVRVAAVLAGVAVLAAVGASISGAGGGVAGAVLGAFAGVIAGYVPGIRDKARQRAVGREAGRAALRAAAEPSSGRAARRFCCARTAGWLSSLAGAASWRSSLRGASRVRISRCGWSLVVVG